MQHYVVKSNHPNHHCVIKSLNDWSAILITILKWTDHYLDSKSMHHMLIDEDQQLKHH